MFFFLFGEDKTSTGPYTSPFDSIKQLDDEGNEFWYARDLQKLLEYTEYRKFLPVIAKAKKHVKAVVIWFLTISPTWAEWLKLGVAQQGMSMILN